MLIPRFREMHLVQRISCILLLVHLTFSRSIPFRQASNDTLSESLDKRWDFDITGLPLFGTRPPGPITLEDVNRYIDQIIELCQYIIENTWAGDATYIQFFGRSTTYPDVMNVFRRVIDLRTHSGGQGLANHLKFVMNSVYVPPPAEVWVGNPVGLYTNEQDGPKIELFAQWKTARPLLEVVLLPGRTEPNTLRKFLYTRQGTIFHELMHFVGDRKLYGPVEPDWPDFAGFDRGSILDVFLVDAVGTDGDIDFLMEEFKVIDIEEIKRYQAYGEQKVLALPQLSTGWMSAMHNAETYVLYAYAILTNWNVNQKIVPKHGEVAEAFRLAAIGDALAHTKTPFQNQGRDTEFANLWWKLLGRGPP